MGSLLLVPIEAPKAPCNYNLLYGPPIDPLKRVQLFSPDDFEEFIKRWADGCLKSKYNHVERCGGAGDNGRDIVAYDNLPSDGMYDNYQCKHYDHALYPSDIWLEIGKLCYYTYSGEYAVPKNYYFVASQDIGPDLVKLLEKPDEIKNGLIENWDNKCKEKIIKGARIELKDDLRLYTENFDFSIIQHQKIDSIINDLRATPWFIPTFGWDFTKHRPDPTKPSENIDKIEIRYVEQLFEAYSDHLKQTVNTIPDLKAHDHLYKHFTRQRESFYRAESLREFSKDSFASLEPFEKLKDEVFDSVIDIVESDYEDGYKCIQETIKYVKTLQFTDNILNTFIHNCDKCGVCHQLANDDKLRWVKK